MLLTINTIALQGKQDRLLREVHSVIGNNRGLSRMARNVVLRAQLPEQRRARH